MLTGCGRLAKKTIGNAFPLMSEEQLTALLAKLKQDAGLRERLKSAADLDAAVKIAKGAGFDVSNDDWLSYQAMQTELNDEELEKLAGGGESKSTCGNKTNCGRKDHCRTPSIIG